MDASPDLEGPDLVYDLLDRYFLPAKKGEPARQVTTTEMYEALAEHAPRLFSTTDVYHALHDRGFLTDMVGDEIKWLVRGR